MTDIESKVYLDLARIWNIGPGEVEKMVRDYIGAVTCDFKPLKLYSKPPIYIEPVKVKSLKEKIDNYKRRKKEMKATSVQNIKNVKDICISAAAFPMGVPGETLTIVASTNDDIFEFNFEGFDLVQKCKKAGLFSGWEKEQKIRELEKENKSLLEVIDKTEEENKNLRIQVRVLEDIKKENYELKAKSKDISDDNASLLETNKKLKKELNYWKKEAADCLRLRDERKEEAINLKQENEKLEKRNKQNKELANAWAKEYYYLSKKIDKLQEENEQYKEAAERRFNEKLHDFKINNKKYDGKIMEEILKRNSGRYPLDDEKSSTDNVNHPSHYTGKYECIDVMQDVFGDEATNNFCLCNAFKYIWRARKKNGLEDIKKAVWYLNKYIEEAEKDGEDKVTRT